MLKRKVAAETVFNYIKSIGYKPTKIIYGDSYFIFDKGDDGVIWFKIKGFGKWKFAMWINTNREELKNTDGADYPALQFFVQHEDNIDKFKPSRSYFLAEYSLEQLEQPAEYQWYEISEILHMIKRHPFLSYVMDYHGSYCYDGSYYIWKVIRSKLFYKKDKIETWCNDWIPYVWTKLKIFMFNKNPIIESINLIDGNTDAWTSSPRFTLQIIFKENSTDAKEVMFLNKWFKKDSYGNLTLEYGRVGIEGTYIYTNS